MRKILSVSILSAILASPIGAQEAKEPATPSDVIAAAPASDWIRIAPDHLMVMDLGHDSAGKPRRVVIQLMPAPFSQGWVGNIRKLVAARWYDGISVVRVQDNYVTQWGDPDGEDPKKAKALPGGLVKVPESDYVSRNMPDVGQYVWGPNGRQRIASDGAIAGSDKSPPPSKFDDPYAQAYAFPAGMPVAVRLAGKGRGPQEAWPLHCYGMVGVGRNLSPDTGTGAELYTVIGQAPRQLDRNIAVVGRIIEGIENLSALPRGTGPLGFYEDPAQRVKIMAVRMGNEVPGLPGYEYMSTESNSFAAFANKRANRKDSFYIEPAGGADACNVPVPIRVTK